MNGWVRLGIVATVLWGLVASAITFATVSTAEREKRQRAYDRAFNACEIFGTEKPGDKAGACHDEAWTEYSREYHARDKLSPTLASALIPPFAMWFLAFFIVDISRWVAAGFRKT